ncbi:MAG: hypothetical protein KGY81_05645 [Phycisphaerae bacterium]|jgi:hypothetical protein|nr:hypothetical protein [Phycisphaerae bacterium]
MADTHCIYCDKPFDPSKGVGDHVIPACLGEFKDDLQFRGLCPVCNGKIGRFEQQVAQSGPEGFFRRLVAPTSKRLRRSGKQNALRQRGALGAPRPDYEVSVGDRRVPVISDDSNPETVQLFDVLCVTAANGDKASVHLSPGIAAETIVDRIRKGGIEPSEECAVRLYSEAINYEAYLAEIKKIWPNKEWARDDSIPTGKASNLDCKVTFRVKVPYFQAIAKIAFHYFLLYSPRGYKGSEPFFEDIRHFIMQGGVVENFFKPGLQDISLFNLPIGELPDGNICTPTQWSHVLAAAETKNQAIGYVHLFIGPGCIPQPHYVWLGNLPEFKVYLPKTAWGHSYIYDDQQTAGRYSGNAAPVKLSRLP